MEATWNGALFSAATIRLPVSTQSSRRAFGKAVVQRWSYTNFAGNQIGIFRNQLFFKRCINLSTSAWYS
jgi:hypothetical protein